MGHRRKKVICNEILDTSDLSPCKTCWYQVMELCCFSSRFCWMQSQVGWEIVVILDSRLSDKSVNFSLNTSVLMWFLRYSFTRLIVQFISAIYLIVVSEKEQIQAVHQIPRRLWNFENNKAPSSESRFHYWYNVITIRISSKYIFRFKPPIGKILCSMCYFISNNLWQKCFHWWSYSGRVYKCDLAVDLIHWN